MGSFFLYETLKWFLYGFFPSMCDTKMAHVWVNSLFLYGFSVVIGKYFPCETLKWLLPGFCRLPRNTEGGRRPLAVIQHHRNPLLDAGGGSRCRHLFVRARSPAQQGRIFLQSLASNSKYTRTG